MLPRCASRPFSVACLILIPESLPRCAREDWGLWLIEAGTVPSTIRSRCLAVAFRTPALTSRSFRNGARGARVASRDESLDTGRGIRWTDKFARIGVMRALNRHVERVFSPDRKEHHWGRRQLARDR